MDILVGMRKHYVMAAREVLENWEQWTESEKKAPITGVCEKIIGVMDKAMLGASYGDYKWDRYEEAAIYESEKYRLQREFSKSWPLFSGLYAYPVPAPESFDLDGVWQTVQLEDYNLEKSRAKHAYYDDTYPKYSGEYGALRKQYLEFIANTEV